MSKRFLVFVNVPEGTRTPNSLGDVVNILTGIDVGQVEGGLYVADDQEMLDLYHSLYDLMDDSEDETTRRIKNLNDRLLADDYTGTGVYEAIELVLDNAMDGVDDIDETADSIHDPMS